MKDLFFKDNIQFGIWKFLDEVDGDILPQFACAQPIFDGVRVSDGKGIIGDVGVCEINIAPIGCAGALSYLKVLGQDIELSILILVDDNVVGRVDGGLQVEEINAILAPFGLVWGDQGIVSNRNQYVRLRLIAGFFDETGSVLEYINFWRLPSLDNPTVGVKEISPNLDLPVLVEPQVYDEDAHGPSYTEVLVCFSPNNSGGVISCDGAIDNIGFFITGNWKIYIDDETEPYVGYISDALSQLFSSYSGKITGDWDGAMFMQNIDNVPHRFRFVPESNTNYVPDDIEGNPTFMEHDDGSLTFCLSPAI